MLSFILSLSAPEIALDGCNGDLRLDLRVICLVAGSRRNHTVIECVIFVNLLSDDDFWLLTLIVVVHHGMLCKVSIRIYNYKL